MNIIVRVFTSTQVEFNHIQGLLAGIKLAYQSETDYLYNLYIITS
jgi:hypothetical protein